VFRLGGSDALMPTRGASYVLDYTVSKYSWTSESIPAKMRFAIQRGCRILAQVAAQFVGAANRSQYENAWLEPMGPHGASELLRLMDGKARNSQR
jgi:hypothetical protein